MSFDLFFIMGLFQVFDVDNMMVDFEFSFLDVVEIVYDIIDNIVKSV